jgi:hypothetical protein
MWVLSFMVSIPILALSTCVYVVDIPGGATEGVIFNPKCCALTRAQVFRDCDESSCQGHNSYRHYSVFTLLPINGHTTSKTM